MYGKMHDEIEISTLVGRPSASRSIVVFMEKSYEQQ